MQVPLDSILTEVMEWGMDEGIVADGALAKSEAQRAVFWRLREEQPEGQRRLGAQLKHDLSVPPGQLGEFLDRANNVCSELLKGVTINAFGHLGDGNVHYNLSPPLGQQDFSGLDSEFTPSWRLSHRYGRQLCRRAWARANQNRAGRYVAGSVGA